MSLKIIKPLVSVEWLNTNLENENLIILDATMPNVTAIKGLSEEKTQIKGAVFFDIKKVFSDVNVAFPNTVLSAEMFEEKAQELGINNDHCIVIYDDLGIYASPRLQQLGRNLL